MAVSLPPEVKAKSSKFQIPKTPGASRNKNLPLQGFLRLWHFCFRPPVEAFSEGPKDKHADNGAGGVDEDVGDHGGAGGDEDLVEFIARGVEEDDEDGDGSLAPAPGSRVATHGLADGAPEKQTEDRVFREVAAFADGMVNGFDVRLRHVRKQPMQERFNQAGGMGVRLGVGGADEYQ